MSGELFANNIDRKNSKVVATIRDAETLPYAIFNTGHSGRKLYAKGDIFFSKVGTGTCFRIEEITGVTLILRDVDSNVTRELKQGDKISLEGSEAVFEKTIAADTLEYRYRAAENISEEDSKDFTVKGLDREKVVLERAFDKKAFLKKLRAEEKEMLDSLQGEAAGSEAIKSEFFDSIEIKEVSDDTWSVDKDSARRAFSNAGRALVAIMKGAEPGFTFGEGASLRFNCELGKVFLDREGFLVTDLADAVFAERVGIRQGDLILAINSRSVNSLYGVFKAYMDIRFGSNIDLVKLDIVREGKPRTLLYKIR